jgi:hypothetical protein
MEVGFHELEDQVEVFVIVGFDDVVEFDDVGMVEFVEEDNFSVGALGIGGVLEGIEYFFECEGFPSFFIIDFPNMSICATT